MEGVLVIAGMKAGLTIDIIKKQYPRNDLIPFESEHRFTAILHHSHSGNAYIALKDAAEQLLKR